MSWLNESNYGNNTCNNNENVVIVEALRKNAKIRDETGFCTKMSAKSNFTPNYFGL